MVSCIRHNYPSDAAPWKRIRYLIIAMITFAISLSLAARSTMSIAIVAMTDNTTNPFFQTFAWSLTSQSNVLSSFFWGHVASSIPAGILLQKFGVRWLFPGALGVAGVLMSVHPSVAYSWGWEGICLVRALLGASLGFVLPSYSALLAVWVTPAERATLGSICLSGQQIGNILALSIGGELASSSVGWPSIFYIFGGLCFVWCGAWILIGFNTPADHPYISQKEMTYIMSQLGNSSKPEPKTPWISIMKSIPLWSAVIGQCAQNWGYYMLLNESPTYINYILNYDIQLNGILTALPFVALLLLTYLCGWISDLIIGRRILPLKWTRKIFFALGFLGPLISMVGLAFSGRQRKELAVVFLILSRGLNAGIYVSLSMNHVELSPKFASILMGVINCFSSIVSLIVPILFAAFVTQNENEEQWQILFYFTAGVYLVGGLVYVIFSSNKLQPWNDNDAKYEERN